MGWAVANKAEGEPGLEPSLAGGCIRPVCRYDSAMENVFDFE